MIIRSESISPFNFSRLEIRYYTATTSADISFAIVTVPPEAKHKKCYSNRSEKYYYVIEGEIIFEIEGKAQSLIKGDFCIISMGKTFAYRNITTLSAVMALVHSPSFDLTSEIFLE